MERDILRKILESVNSGHVIKFEADWGGNSITVFIDEKHSHCGLPESSFDELIESLYKLLVENEGLSFV